MIWSYLIWRLGKWIRRNWLIRCPAFPKFLSCRWREICARKDVHNELPNFLNFVSKLVTSWEEFTDFFLSRIYSFLSVESFYLPVPCNVWPVSLLIWCFYVFHSNLTGLSRLLMQCVLLFSRTNNDYFVRVFPYHTKLAMLSTLY